MASVDSFISGDNLDQAIKCAEKVLGRSQLNIDASGQARTASTPPVHQTSTINSQLQQNTLHTASLSMRMQQKPKNVKLNLKVSIGWLIISSNNFFIYLFK